MPVRIVVVSLLCGGLLACGNQDHPQPDKQPATEIPAGVVATCMENLLYAGYLPLSGCTCRSIWSYNGKTVCNGECAAPDNDPNGPWCYTTAACYGQTWSYCSRPSQP